MSRWLKLCPTNNFFRLKFCPISYLFNNEEIYNTFLSALSATIICSVLIKDKGNIFLYSKGTFLVNHLINSATLLGISDFLHVRMFLQINGHSLIIFTILYNYKTENLVHFFNTTTFGLFYNLFGNGVTSL